MFGSLTISLLKKLALPSVRHLVQISLISMALADLLTGLLRAVNFVYWKYFRGFRYVFSLIGVLLHYNMNIDFGNIPWINVVIFFYCASYVAVYLVDFTWLVGQDICDQQPLVNRAIIIGVLGGVVGLLISKTVYARSEPIYMGYLIVLVVLGLVVPKGRVASALLVVLFAQTQRLSTELWQ